MTEITINIDAHLIAEAAAIEAVRRAFSASKYAGEAGGPGFEEVKAQVRRRVAALDLGDMIDASIAKQLPAVVDDVVGELLAAAVKKRAKASAGLFEGKA